MNVPALVTMAALMCLSPLAQAGRLKLAGATASSEYPPEDGNSYGSRKATDGKLSTSWVEGDDGSGLGSWIEVDLGGEKEVSEVRLYGGMWYSQEYWSRGNRPSEVELQFSDGSTESFALADEMSVQSHVLASPKKTTSVRVKVKGVHSGTTWLDTAISEIQVLDTSASGPVVVGLQASSTLPADGDGSYEAGHVADGISDSMWCEGVKGDGVGQSLELTFEGPVEVSQLKMINGIGTSMPFWAKGHRVARASLEFSDGSTEEVAVKNTLLAQTVSFPAHTTSTVKFTILEAVAGKEYDDLCVSELSFE